MSEVNKTLKTKQQEKTLETEVKQFASKEIREIEVVLEEIGNCT